MFYKMKMMVQSFLLLGIVFSTKLIGQSLGINNNGSTNDASAMLYIKSKSKEFLVHRFSSKVSFTSPVTVLLVYATLAK